jgi:hypothetical protein
MEWIHVYQYKTRGDGVVVADCPVVLHARKVAWSREFLDV